MKQLSLPARGALILLPLIATCAVVYAVLWAAKVRARGRVEAELPVIAELPPFRLVERGGGSVGLEDLRGKVWVADFFFTSCSGPCLRMTAKMADLQESLRKAGDVLLVSFTVDPVRDTPAVLARYADSHGARPGKWLMLTGEEDAVRKLVIEGFKLAAAPGDPSHAVLHSTRIVVVDRLGRVRSYRDALEPDSHERVLRDVGLLLAKERE